MAKQVIGEVAAAAAASVISGAIGAAAGGTSAETRAIYKTEKNPPFAPPGWAFPVAWTVNNTLLAWIAIQAAKAPNTAPGKREVLALLGVHSALFAAWPLGFVRLRSPLLGAAVTAADFGVNVAAAFHAARLDRRYALGFTVPVAWLAFASALAGVIALKNDDPLFGIHREGNARREKERIDAQLLRQQELAERQLETHPLHGEDKIVADTFPASDPPQTP